MSSPFLPSDFVDPPPPPFVISFFSPPRFPVEVPPSLLPDGNVETDTALQRTETSPHDSYLELLYRRADLSLGAEIFPPSYRHFTCPLLPFPFPRLNQKTPRFSSPCPERRRMSNFFFRSRCVQVAPSSSVLTALSDSPFPSSCRDTRRDLPPPLRDTYLSWSLSL